jgi:type II secretory pathway component PulC
MVQNVIINSVVRLEYVSQHHNQWKNAVSQDIKWTMVIVLQKDRLLNVTNECIHPMPVDLQSGTYLSVVVNLLSNSLDEIVGSVAS